MRRVIIKNMDKIDDKSRIRSADKDVESGLNGDRVGSANNVSEPRYNREHSVEKKDSASASSVTSNKKTASAPVPPNQKAVKTIKNSTVRIYTGMLLILGLAIALFLRSVWVYFFDVVILAIICACIYDIVYVKNLGCKVPQTKSTKFKQDRDERLKISYLYMYLGIAYTVFLFGLVYSPAFSFWAHLIAQAVVFCIWSLYIFFLNYVDEGLVRQCRLKKIGVAKESMKTVGKYWSVVFYPAVLLYGLFALNHIDPSAAPNTEFGLFSLVLVFVISSFTDTFAYMTGSFFKGPKLLPERIRYISPNKTWSGAFGGIVGGVLGSLLVIAVFSGITEFSNFMTAKIGDSTAVILLFALIGILGSLFTQAGDIYASRFKRKSEVKDFGKYLPSHGGAMDRADGISFNTVFISISMLIIVFLG